MRAISITKEMLARWQRDIASTTFVGTPNGRVIVATDGPLAGEDVTLTRDVKAALAEIYGVPLSRVNRDIED